MARRTSAEPIDTVLGSPVTRSRPRDPVGQLLAQREGRAAADLEVLGAALPEQQRVLALDVADERLVDLVAADAHGARGDDAAEADDGDVGGAAADVDDHRGAGLLDRQAGADRGRHRLLDDVDPAGAGAQGGVLEGPALDAGDVARHADARPVGGSAARARPARRTSGSSAR